MSRGFASIGLVRPKDVRNVGAVLRAAHVYGASLVAIQGDRTPIKSHADTTKAYRHIPIVRGEDLFSLCPYGAIPIAVDLVAVPTRFCMNLAATVNVVLYDRLAKSERPALKLVRSEAA